MTQLQRSFRRILSKDSKKFEVSIDEESIYNDEKDSQSLLCDESDVLLDKQTIQYLERETICDLEKNLAVFTPPPFTNSKQLPSHLNEGLKKLLRTPSKPDYDTEPSSQKSEDDYLPSTLRAAISITDNTEDFIRKHQDNNYNRVASPTSASPTSASNRETNNLKKTKSRSVRRTKSEKCENTRMQKNENKNMTQSLHLRDLDTSNHVEKPASAISLGMMRRSEELKKPEKRASGKDRHRTENLHELPSSNRPQRGRSRKAKSSRSLARSKPSSSRKPKGNRKDLNTSEDDSLLVYWNRQPSQSVKQEEKSRKKLKKSGSRKDLDTSQFDKLLVFWDRQSSQSDEQEGEAQKKLEKSGNHKDLDTSQDDKLLVNWKRLPSQSVKPKKKAQKKLKKSGNRKDLDISQDEKLLVPGNRQPTQSDKKKEKAQKKLKKASSGEAKAKRTRQSSKSSRNSLQAPVVSNSDQQNVEWKRRSPPQKNRKKSPKKKHGSKQSDPQKLSESSDIKSKKPKSRRAMLMSSKATTESCRDLLRTIHAINNDRLSSEMRPVDTINGESQTSSAELLSRSTKPTQKDTTDKETKKSNEESLSDLNDNNNSSKSQRELQDEERPRKPPRTKSAPLTLKGKNFNKKIRRSQSSNVLLKTDFEAVQTKPKKKALSSWLLGMLPEGKGAAESKDAEDVTILTGNRSKDKKERKRFFARSKSDSSLRENPRKQDSNYDLMVSMHSTAEDEEMKKDYSMKNTQSDVDNDDSASNPMQLKMPSLVSSEDINEGSSEMMSIAIFPKENAQCLPDHDDWSHKVGSKKLSEHVSEQSISAHCDDIVSMPELSSQRVVKVKDIPGSKPKQLRCLQIDFSQLSEHGTSGNIFVRSQKLEKRVNSKNGKPKSNRQVWA